MAKQLAPQLVNTLLRTGDRLVVLDFYSPGCGGCRTLHPKIKKFKDAMGKHSTDQWSLGPAKGLEESEITRMVASGLIPEKGSSPPLPASAGEGLMVKELMRQAEIGK
ncbi:Thioredoxin-like 1-2, chloroplastic [Linum perenne]